MLHASLTLVCKNSQLLEDFEGFFDSLLERIIESAADADIGSPCSCNGGIRTTQCHDCLQYRASCPECFIRAHQNNPFHWAEVWDAERGFFVKHDISALGATVSLGHYGASCPNPKNNILFTVVDTNGVHATRLSLCGCLGAGSKVDQLMRARLFPATTRDTKSAFTFKVLKDFHIHNLESKEAAFDYLGAIRRLTDNVFTADVPVSFKMLLSHQPLSQAYLEPWRKLLSCRPCLEVPHPDGASRTGPWHRQHFKVPQTKESHRALSRLPRAGF